MTELRCAEFDAFARCVPVPTSAAGDHVTRVDCLSGNGKLHTAQQTPSRTPNDAREQGSALLWALLFVIVTAGMVVSHTAYMAARRGERDARHNRESVADTFARSGLRDAVGWFHRHSTQPITTFDPVYDPTGNPPRVETIDPTIGLVREFEINGSLRGRYEVRHEAVADISAQRGLTPGSSWEIGVRAFVFRQRDANKAFNQAPNQLVATRALTSELRWLHINPPSPAALCADKPSDVTIGAEATLEGGASIALAYQDPAAIGKPPSTPTIAGTLVGMPSQLAAPAYDSSAGRVFGMRLDELRAYSDVVIDEGRHGGKGGKKGKKGKRGGKGTSEPAANLEALRAWLSENDAAARERVGTVIFSKDLELDGDLRLSNVLLVVEGKLTDNPGHRTYIHGVVYVTGRIDLDEGEFELDGALIGRKRVRLGDEPGARVLLRYDASALDRLRQTAGKYRQRRGASPQ